MLDGSVIFHKIALAILKLSQDILLEYDFESIVYYIKNLPDEGILQQELLIPTAMNFKITQRMLRGLERQYYLEEEEQEQRDKEREEQRAQGIEVEENKQDEPSPHSFSSSSFITP